MAVYLVDFENVSSAGISGIQKLTKEDKVYIFYTVNASTMSFAAHLNLLQSPAEVVYYNVSSGGKNALDFQLASFLGYLICQGKEKNFCIISNDRGFEYVKTFWERNGISADISVSGAPSINRALLPMEKPFSARIQQNTSENAELAFENKVISKPAGQAMQPKQITSPPRPAAQTNTPVAPAVSAQPKPAPQPKPAVQPSPLAKPAAPAAAPMTAPAAAKPAAQPAPAVPSASAVSSAPAAPSAPAAQAKTEEKTPKRRGRPPKNPKPAEAPKAEAVPEAPKPEVKKDTPNQDTPKQEAPKPHERTYTPGEIPQSLKTALAKADVTDSHDISCVMDLLENTDNKQQFYRGILKLFGMEKGVEVYKAVRPEYGNLAKQFSR